MTLTIFYSIVDETSNWKTKTSKLRMAVMNGCYYMYVCYVMYTGNNTTTTLSWSTWSWVKLTNCNGSVNITFNDEIPREVVKAKQRWNDQAKRSKDHETVRPAVTLVDVTASSAFTAFTALEHAFKMTSPALTSNLSISHCNVQKCTHAIYVLTRMSGTYSWHFSSNLKLITERKQRKMKWQLRKTTSK